MPILTPLYKIQSTHLARIPDLQSEVQRIDGHKATSTLESTTS